MGFRDLSPCRFLHHKNSGVQTLKDVAKELAPRTESTAAITRDLHEKTTALDKERFEVVCLRQDIIDEYEKKSGELLEYLNSMEAAFERQRREYEEREAVLRKENKALKQELQSHGSSATRPVNHDVAAAAAEPVLTAKSRHHRADKSWEIAEHALDVLKDDSMEHVRNYKTEQKRTQELQGCVNELQQEIEKKEELAVRRRRRMDETKKRMEGENQELRRKAALGWMLGCLSELYLRLDPEIGAAGIMKLVRKVQRELEAGSSVFGNGEMPPKLEYETIQKEIRRLISRAQASRMTPLRRAMDACTMIKQGVTSARGRAFDGEPLGERRRRRRRSCDAQCQAEDGETTRPSTARPSTSLPPTVRKSVASQRFIVNCVDNEHNPHSCHVTCHPASPRTTGFDSMELLREKRMRGEVVDLKKAAKHGRRTWAEIRFLGNEEAAFERASQRREMEGLLKGLESRVNFLMSRERRRRGCEK